MPEEKKVDIESAPSKNKKINISLIYSSLALIISIFILFLSLFFFYELKNYKFRHDNYWMAARSEQDISEIKIKNLNHEIAVLKNNQIDDKNQFAKIKTAIDKLLSEKESPNNYWVLVETYHKLNLANLSLHYAYDRNGALTLLKSAVQQLELAKNISFAGLQEAIVIDIAKLDAMPQVDLSSLLKNIKTLQDRIKTLPLIVLKSAQIETDDTKITDKSWRNYWQKNLEKLSKLIVIRHHEIYPIQPLLTLEQENNLKTTLILAFQQVALAAMRSDNEIYQWSLKEAENLINIYFVSNTERDAMMRDIAQLKSQTFVLEFSDLDKTISLAAKLLATGKVTPT